MSIGYKLCIVGGEFLYVSYEQGEKIKDLKLNNASPNIALEINGEVHELGRIKSIVRGTDPHKEGGDVVIGQKRIEDRRTATDEGIKSARELLVARLEVVRKRKEAEEAKRRERG